MQIKKFTAAILTLIFTLSLLCTTTVQGSETDFEIAHGDITVSVYDSQTGALFDQGGSFDILAYSGAYMPGRTDSRWIAAFDPSEENPFRFTDTTYADSNWVFGVSYASAADDGARYEIDTTRSEYIFQIPDNTPRELVIYMKPVGDDTLMGDVNGDGTVDAADVKMLSGYLLTCEKLSAAQVAAADINHDSLLNVTDLSLLRRTVLAPASLQDAVPTFTGSYQFMLKAPLLEAYFAQFLTEIDVNAADFTFHGMVGSYIKDENDAQIGRTYKCHISYRDVVLDVRQYVLELAIYDDDTIEIKSEFWNDAFLQALTGVDPMPSIGYTAAMDIAEAYCTGISLPVEETGGVVFENYDPNDPTQYYGAENAHFGDTSPMLYIVSAGEHALCYRIHGSWVVTDVYGNDANAVLYVDVDAHSGDVTDFRYEIYIRT